MYLQKEERYGNEQAPQKAMQIVLLYFDIMEQLSRFTSFGAMHTDSIQTINNLDSQLIEIRKKLERPSLEAEGIRLAYLDLCKLYKIELSRIKEKRKAFDLKTEISSRLILINAITDDFKRVLIKGVNQNAIITGRVKSIKRGHRVFLSFFEEFSGVLNKNKFRSYWQAILAYRQLKHVLAELHHDLLEMDNL